MQNPGKLLNELRNQKLTDEQKSAIATKASHARKSYKNKRKRELSTGISQKVLTNNLSEDKL